MPSNPRNLPREAELSRARRAKRIASDLDGKSKACCACGQVKPLIDYYQHSRSTDGRSYRCKTCVIASVTASKKKNPHKVSGWNKAAELRRKYGIGLHEYEAMVALQNGKCLVCEGETPLCVDHCHATKKVRGLLCIPCNLALGHIRENKSAAMRLVRYIEERCHF